MNAFIVIGAGLQGGSALQCELALNYEVTPTATSMLAGMEAAEEPVGDIRPQVVINELKAHHKELLTRMYSTGSQLSAAYISQVLKNKYQSMVKDGKLNILPILTEEKLGNIDTASAMASAVLDKIGKGNI